MKNPGNDFLTRLGTVLIILGVSVWGVYAVLHYVLGLRVNPGDFLPVHLAGVVPGVALRRRRAIVNLYNKYLGKQ